MSFRKGGAAGAAALICAAALVPGCTARSKLYCDRDTPCADPAIPYCDLDGTFQKKTNRCIENPYGSCVGDADCPGAAPICDDVIGCVPCTQVSSGSSDPSSVGASGDAACAAKSAATPMCYEDGRCIGCTETRDCGADAPLCDLSSLTCVGCTPGAAGDVACTVRGGGTDVCDPFGHCVECVRDSQCTDPEAAFCGADGLCRGCVAHAECDSGVCDRNTGACVPEDEIQYDSLSTPPDGVTFIKLSNGIFSCHDPDVDGLSIIGSGATVFKDCVLVRNGGTIDDVIFDGGAVVGRETDFHDDTFIGTMTIDFFGAFWGCTFTNDGKLTIGDADVHACQFERDTLLEGVGVIEDSTFDGAGVHIVGKHETLFETESSNDVLVLDRCDIRRSNADAAIELKGVDYEIRNTIIAGNAGTGVLVSTAAPNKAVFELNTVVDNGGTGVACAEGTSVATSSIVRGNGVAQVSGGCTWQYSNVEEGTTGPGNIDADPEFVAADLGDYHLRPESPCVDTGEEGLTSTGDIDGDARPLGGGVDMGADELVP